MSLWWLTMGLLACEKSTMDTAVGSATDASEEVADGGFLDGGPPAGSDADGATGDDGGSIDSDGSVDSGGTDTVADDDVGGDDGSVDGGSPDDDSADTGSVWSDGTTGSDPGDDSSLDAGAGDDDSGTETGSYSSTPSPGMVFDRMLVHWDGVFLGGIPTTASRMSPSGGMVEVEPVFVIDLRDNERYSIDIPDAYNCRFTYLQAGAVTPMDFSGHAAWMGHSGMGFNIDLAAASPPLMEGACAEVADLLGEPIQTFLERHEFGFGWGPMTTSFSSELSAMLPYIYDAMGDTPGVAYLKWYSAGGSAVAAWNFYQVTPFVSGDLLDESGLYVSGVSDGSTPADGHYQMGSVYGERIDPYVLTVTAE